MTDSGREGGKCEPVSSLASDGPDYISDNWNGDATVLPR